MKTRKKLAIIITSLVLALGLCLVASAAVSSVTPGGDASVTSLTVDGTGVTTVDSVVCCSHTPTFKGYTTVKSTINFRISSPDVTGSTTSDDNGYFEWTAPYVEDGVHTVYATVTDSYENTSAETKIATINTSCEGLASVGVMIAKIGLIALVIFMVLLSGYFALRKKEVKA
jgi:hypothetical protein